MLVIDELGYLSHATDAANVLYRVVNERYLKDRPMLLMTNKPLGALGDVLHDSDLAEAIWIASSGGAHTLGCVAARITRVTSARTRVTSARRRALHGVRNVPDHAPGCDRI